jgi:muramoyltetrapeptide carboxypeptidase
MTSRPALKAPRLKPGGTVGVVSPSWGGAGLFPHRVAQGVRHLQALGFQVKLAPNALNQYAFVSDTPEKRAADIHAMFADHEVMAVIAAIGGDHACHLLPHLDYDLIRANPKIFMGYSDTTVLNVALWHQIGLVTFNGPMLLPDFGEYPRMLDYTESYFLKAAAGAGPVGAVAPAAHWTEEFLDWEQKEDLRRPRTLQPSEGWVWLKPGRAEGRLLGGAIESLQHLRGTDCWPDWDGAILFFETTEDKPSPETVDGLLMDYENMGVLEKLHGMLVGRAMRYSPDEKHRLRERILERTHKYTFPIITDMDFGHTAPQLTLPLGCQAQIESDSMTFAIVEPAVV